MAITIKIEIEIKTLKKPLLRLRLGLNNGVDVETHRMVVWLN